MPYQEEETASTGFEESKLNGLFKKAAVDSEVNSTTSETKPSPEVRTKLNFKLTTK